MAQTGRCKCSGHWSQRLRHWVVTQRGFAINGMTRERNESKSCEVKCLQCKRKFRTLGRYVAKLPDYKERTYAKLSEAEVFLLVMDGRIKADPDTGDIWKELKRIKRWTGEWKKLRATPDKKSGHLFIDIKYGGARRWVAMNRLVWMATNLEEIPEGYEVDHENGIRDDNRPENLRLLLSHINKHVYHHGEEAPAEF